MNIVEKDTDIGSLLLSLATGYVEHLGFANQENIETGMSGELLFLLKLYQQTHDSRHLEKIQVLADELIAYCKANPSGNYSLYTGRAGAAYALIQSYHATGKDDHYLEEAIAMLTNCTGSYLHSEHVSDYLYDGRAGTLLVLAQLHALSGKTWLVPYVESFIDKIVSNATFSREGISWRNQWEIEVKNSCGFAYGAAGIKYVLDQINPIYTNAGLQYLSNGIGKYIDHCWIEATQCWACQKVVIIQDEVLSGYREMYARRDWSLLTPVEECGWATGAAGIGLVCEKNNGPRTGVEIKLRMAVESGRIGSFSLFEGLAGIGLASLQQWPENKALQETIVADVLEKLLSCSDTIDLEGGLLYGQLGCVYFLLQANEAQATENVLVPFLRGSVPVVAGIKNIPVRSGALMKHYPRTLSLLKEIAPDALRIYLEGPQEKEYVYEVLAFEKFIAGISIHLRQGTQRECVTDVYSFEKKRHDFLLSEKRSHLQCYLEESLRYEKAMKLLNQPCECFLDEWVVISNTVQIISTGWNWSFTHDFGPFDEPQVDQLAIPKGEFYYILQLSRSLEVVETFLKTDLLLLMQCFQQPCTIRQALEEIRSLVEGMPDNFLMQQLLLAEETADVKDFRFNLDNIVLYEIRQWIVSGVLRSVKR